MQKIALIGASTAALAASLMNSLGSAATSAARGVHRVSAGTKRGRQMVSVKTPHSRSKYVPHIGKKEQERAKRCYMSSTFNASGNPRSAPVMHQVGKHAYEAALVAHFD